MRRSARADMARIAHVLAGVTFPAAKWQLIMHAEDYGADATSRSDLWRLPVDPRTGLPTGGPGPVVETTREDSRGAWSPDGKLIAFDRLVVGTGAELYVMNADGSGKRSLMRADGGVLSQVLPWAWSPTPKRQ